MRIIRNNNKYKSRMEPIYSIAAQVVAQFECLRSYEYKILVVVVANFLVVWNFRCNCCCFIPILGRSWSSHVYNQRSLKHIYDRRALKCKWFRENSECTDHWRARKVCEQNYGTYHRTKSYLNANYAQLYGQLAYIHTWQMCLPPNSSTFQHMQYTWVPTYEYLLLHTSISNLLRRSNERCIRWSGWMARSRYK